MTTLPRLSGRRLYRRYRTRRYRLPDDAPWTDTPSYNRLTWRTTTTVTPQPTVTVTM
ncbi:hypothetical protein IL992_21940 [Microbispora sp. NEAU-D428]|uniref:hypothetical protein n=1 Tax=Microbispora sitophila TaxID=2771537 RepID=UPI0018667CA4|nr:hypothetical protein [Microbispora sitophila]MBE3011840.1 hypothetical protein [Microbispora sitophila]